MRISKLNRTRKDVIAQRKAAVKTQKEKIDKAKKDLASLTKEVNNPVIDWPFAVDPKRVAVALRELAAKMEFGNIVVHSIHHDSSASKDSFPITNLSISYTEGEIL